MMMEEQAHEDIKIEGSNGFKKKKFTCIINPVIRREKEKEEDDCATQSWGRNGALDLYL